MDALEIVKALAGIAEYLGSRPTDGEPIERASTSRLVFAAMQHLAFGAVRDLRNAGTDASIRAKADGSFFELSIDGVSIEIKPGDEGFFVQFSGLGISKRDRALVPIGDRIQHLEVPRLSFDDAITTARELVTRLVRVLGLIAKQRSR